MTIKDFNIKKEYKIENMVEFFRKFDLIKEVKNKYNLKDIDDIYSIGICDQEEIQEWLEKSDRIFTIEYIEYRRCEYFKIIEYNK